MRVAVCAVGVVDAEDLVQAEAVGQREGPDLRSG